MKLEGTADFAYDAADVWTALHDIDILIKTIPGCKSMVLDDEGGYIVAVSLGVAAIKGDYEGKVRVTDVEFPHHYALDGEGSGTPGYINMKVDCFLDATEQGTLMRWACDAEVGYMWWFMKNLADSMTHKISNYRISTGFGVLL